jgi:glycosyltransferase involved in cell wall biosynthesis
MRITLLLPTLNEIDGMRTIMPRVNPAWVDEILVVDGGSTDGTVEYAREAGYRVHHQKSKGITYAYQEALEVATGDIVVAFSPDGNSIPERIPEVVAKMREGWDMVIVSRYCDGAKSEDDDAVTAVGNRLFTAAINLLFGGRYTDSLVMFRAWRKDLVRSFPRNMPRAGIEPMLAIRCAKRKLRTTDIPGDEPKRLGGARKMHPLLNGLDIIKLIAYELVHA